MAFFLYVSFLHRLKLLRVVYFPLCKMLAVNLTFALTHMAKGTFVGLDSATLAALKTQYVQCLAAIAVAGQSYTISGRQFNRAQLNEVKDTIAELQFAIDRANNNIRTMTVAGFGTPYSNS